MSGTGLTFSDSSTQTTSAAPMGVLTIGHTGIFMQTTNGGPFYTGDSLSGSYLYRIASSSGLNRTYFTTSGVWLSGNYTNYTTSPASVSMLGGGSATVYNLSGTWRYLGNWVVPVPSYDAYQNWTTTWAGLWTRVS